MERHSQRHQSSTSEVYLFANICDAELNEHHTHAPHGYAALSESTPHYIYLDSLRVPTATDSLRAMTRAISSMP